MIAEPTQLTGLLRRLSEERAPGPAGIAFDADGTLWSGDVGEDVFETTIERGLLRADPLDELRAVARRYGVEDGPNASDTARDLYRAYRIGAVPELVMCEIMTWAYAGFSVAELEERAHEAFSERKLRSRVRTILAPVFEWADREEVRVVVVTASPRLIVAEALSTVGITVAEIAGAEALVDGAILRPGLRGPVPYGHEKRVAGDRLLGGRQWLASFGDSGFDVEMLRAAAVGVAVYPKPALRARLAEIDGAALLEVSP